MGDKLLNALPSTTSPGVEFQVAEQHSAGPARLRRVLGALSDSGECLFTIYVKPQLSEAAATVPDRAAGWAGAQEAVRAALRHAGDLKTGAVLFFCPEYVISVVPPFPFEHESFTESADVDPLFGFLETKLVVGVVLVRLGRYAVGLLRGDGLAASKTGRRYVKNRHRAGGSSQRRFERSRERLTRELFDKTCSVARDVLEPHKDAMDYVLLGGERQTLLGLVQRCRLLQSLAPVTLQRRLNIREPGQKALEGIHREVWRSRVLELRPVGPRP